MGFAHLNGQELITLFHSYSILCSTDLHHTAILSDTRGICVLVATSRRLCK